MASDRQQGASGDTVSAILATDTVGRSAAVGVSDLGFRIILAGGTIVSLLIGWWLHWRSSRTSSGAAVITASEPLG